MHVAVGVALAPDPEGDAARLLQDCEELRRVGPDGDRISTRVQALLASKGGCNLLTAMKPCPE